MFDLFAPKGVENSDVIVPIGQDTSLQQALKAIQKLCDHKGLAVTKRGLAARIEPSRIAEARAILNGETKQVLLQGWLRRPRTSLRYASASRQKRGPGLLGPARLDHQNPLGAHGGRHSSVDPRCGQRSTERVFCG